MSEECKPNCAHRAEVQGLMDTVRALEERLNDLELMYLETDKRFEAHKKDCNRLYWNVADLGRVGRRPGHMGY